MAKCSCVDMCSCKDNRGHWVELRPTWSCLSHPCPWTPLLHNTLVLFHTSESSLIIFSYMYYLLLILITHQDLSILFPKCFLHSTFMAAIWLEVHILLGPLHSLTTDIPVLSVSPATIYSLV
jgi:hypothetical protein